MVQPAHGREGADERPLLQRRVGSADRGRPPTLATRLGGAVVAFRAAPAANQSRRLTSLLSPGGAAAASQSETDW